MSYRVKKDRILDSFEKKVVPLWDSMTLEELDKMLRECHQNSWKGTSKEDMTICGHAFTAILLQDYILKRNEVEVYEKKMNKTQG